jgi:hypothetical protein
MLWLKLLSFLAPLSTLILGWRQRFTLLWLYAAAGLIIDNTSLLLKHYGLNYHITGNIFVLLELIIFSLFYHRGVFHRSRIFLLTMCTVAMLFVLHTLWNSVWEINFEGAGYLCVIYIAFGVLGYYNMLQKPEAIYLGRSPLFWINTGVFLYAAANSLLFLFITYLKEESFELVKSIWGLFFTSINILHYVLIGIGLYKMKPRGR